MTIDQLKRATGHRAAEYVRSGMVVGLGSGSTAKYATLRLAERLRQGDLRDIVAVPTSDETARLATAEGIPLVSLDEHPRIDVTIDGADEVDPNLDLIKGLGGYLLREKIVAAATDTEVIVVDDSKLVERLGTRSPVPVEVIRFGWHNTRRALEATGAVATTLRLADDKPYVTDEGNWIIDCSYDGIDDAIGLSQAINAIPGVVENGLFIGIAKIVVVASVSGISVLERR
ncbi:MAG TPA: ribose-5-phosphate isomerase RpiA [Chloroflexi bacterium]|jgi:ribose 5-phosphate isomerase A|nr:ribose-5-phosphate isomerase RpiA [Chloroflexota bacterium]